MKQDGGPAFPLPLGTMNAAEPEQSGGMTLRDYFAAAALPSLILHNAEESAENMDINVEHAFQYADLMLKRRGSSLASTRQPNET